MPPLPRSRTRWYLPSRTAPIMSDRHITQRRGGRRRSSTAGHLETSRPGPYQSHHFTETMYAPFGTLQCTYAVVYVVCTGTSMGGDKIPPDVQYPEPTGKTPPLCGSAK